MDMFRNVKGEMATLAESTCHRSAVLATRAATCCSSQVTECMERHEAQKRLIRCTYNASNTFLYESADFQQHARRSYMATPRRRELMRPELCFSFLKLDRRLLLADQVFAGAVCGSMDLLTALG